MSAQAASAHPAGDDRTTLGQRAAATITHPLTRALLVLTFTTGLIDAVSYLGLGRVFTANMTGNVVLLGLGVAGGGGLPVLGPIVSLAAFLVGAAAGGRLAVQMGGDHPRHVAATLLIELTLLGVATVVAAVVDVRPGTADADVVIALLALAMGVRNATVRKIAVPDLTTTVLTMTLTGLAADSRVAGGSGRGSVRRTAAVIAMFAGALAGALLLNQSLALPLLAATGLALATWLVYVPAARREATRQP